MLGPGSAGRRPSVTADKIFLVSQLLTELTESLYLPSGDPGIGQPEVEIEQLAGRQLRHLERIEDRLWRYQVQLDEPLAADRRIVTRFG